MDDDLKKDMVVVVAVVLVGCLRAWGLLEVVVVSEERKGRTAALTVVFIWDRP